MRTGCRQHPQSETACRQSLPVGAAARVGPVFPKLAVSLRRALGERFSNIGALQSDLGVLHGTGTGTPGDSDSTFLKVAH